MEREGDWLSFPLRRGEPIEVLFTMETPRSRSSCVSKGPATSGAVSQTWQHLCGAGVIGIRDVESTG